MTDKSQNISDAQIEHASKWVVKFIETFKQELRTSGVPYKLLYEEYCRTTNFPIYDKAFAPMLHVAGLERIKTSNVVTYILLEVSL